MAYPTLSELQTYIGVGAVDTNTLTQCLNTGIKFVETHCNRQFVPYTATEIIRAVPPYVTRRGQRLSFLRDCISITTLTNGDGTTISSTYYTKRYNAHWGDPANASFYGIDLLPLAGLALTDGTVGYITVLGSWGYHNTESPPSPVFSSILMLAAQLYRVRSGGGGAVAQIQPSGVMLSGVEVDRVVLDMLKEYKRAVL